MGKYLRGVAVNPDGLTGTEWAELDACSCEKKEGRVKCEVLG